MTAHQDVAGLVARLRRRAAFVLRWNDTSSPERHKTLEGEAVEAAPELIESADRLESLSQALREAEAARASDNARLKIQRDNALLDMEAFMNRAEAAESRLAEAMKVIERLIKHTDDFKTFGPAVTAARAFIAGNGGKDG